MTEPGQQPTTTAPGGSPKDWGGRLPLLAIAELDQEQRALYDQLQAGTLPWAERTGFSTRDDAGHLIGPFNVFLHSPQISRSYNDLIGVETSHTELPAPIREIVILTVGVEWQSDYETYAHTAVARSLGLSDAVIDAVLAGEASSDFTAQEAAAHAFTQQLVRNRRVDDAAYARSHLLFGEKGLVDMVQLIGLYLTTSALLNAFNIPAPSLNEGL
jgi:4-carboxymuconolactone decarboxylase